MIDIPFFYTWKNKSGKICKALVIKRLDTSCGYFEIIDPATDKKLEEN